LRKVSKGKYKKLLILFSFLVILFLNFITPNIYDKQNIEKSNNLPEYEKNSPIFSIHSSSDEYSGIGTHQNVTEFGQGFFQNNELNISKSENASIIVPNNWTASEILCNITNINEYKFWMNKTFDTGYNNTYWSNNTIQNYDNVSFDWYNDSVGSNDSIYIKHIGGVNWIGEKTYWNYTFNLDRDEIPFKEWYIDFNYRVITDNINEWIVSAPPPAKFYCKIILNGAVQQFDERKINGFINDTWYSDIIVGFTPEVYGFDPPGTMTVEFGIIWSNQEFTPTGNFTIYFDNITLQLSTIPKPSQINLSLTDNEHGTLNSITDINGYGLGNTSFINNWLGAVGGSEYEFSFASNSTGLVYVDTDIFVNATSSAYTYTELGIKGSEFNVKNGTLTEWTMYFPVSIPGTYETDYYFNISKPENWNITHVIDPYGNDKISDVLETSGPGNTTLVIPNDITVNGRWKIIAESPNYVFNATIWKWNLTASNWEKNASFEISNQIKINSTIDDNLIPYIDLTNATLLIYYPNSTLWSETEQKVSVDSLGNVEFSNFSFGAENASAGEYTVNVRWNNNETSQVGLFVLNFDVTHNTTLNRADDQDEIVSPIFTGDTVLIKVNYTDIDTGVGIIGANVNYTIDNTTAITGDMIYFGGGIYVAEIDTTDWQNGIYNVSVSANKTYYKSQYTEKLIKLHVTETTTLKSPQLGGFNIPWGTNVSIDVFYNVSGNGGISGATIDCDWDLNYYSIQDLPTGHYKVILNTTIKTIETYTLKINATKDGYEYQEIYISINVRKIYTNLTYIQPDPVKFNSHVTIHLNYGDIDNDNWITGADITVSSEIGAQYWDLGDFLYNEISPGTYNLEFNSSIFNSAGTFQIYVTANKTNYADATTLINIFIDNIPTYLGDIFLNMQNKTLEKSIELPIGDNLNITLNYLDYKTGTHIDSAFIQLIGTNIILNLTEKHLLKQYMVNINTTVLGFGVKFLTLIAQKTNYQTSSEIIKITVRQIRTNITTESGEDVINIIAGDNYILKIKLTNLDFGGMIKNATVRYSWDYGQGYLTDEDNNGIYEGILENIPSGTYTIILSVLNVSDDYFFESKVITIISVPHEEDTLLILILLGFSVVAIIVLGSYFVAYQRVLKFPKPIRKIHKFKKTLKKKKAPDVEILPRNVLLKTLYEEELASITKLLKGKINHELPEQQLEQQLLKDKLSKTVSDKTTEESKKNEL